MFARLPKGCRFRFTANPGLKKAQRDDTHTFVFCLGTEIASSRLLSQEGSDAKKVPYTGSDKAPDNLVRVSPPWERPREPEDAMKNFAKKVQRFLVSEDGPTAVEYAVMMALIVIVCLTAIRAVGTNASATFQKVAGQLTVGS